MNRRLVALLGLLTFASACSKEESGSTSSVATTSDALTITLQQKLQSVPGASSSRFGNRLVIGDTQIFASAYQEAVNGLGFVGAVYAFGRAGSSYPQEQRIIPSDVNRNIIFGFSVAASGSTLLVGAPGFASLQTSAAYFFTFNGSAWTEQQKLVPPTNEGFGGAVAFAGDTAFIGASSGVYVYERTGSVWSQIQKIDRPGRNISANLAALGDTVVVGHACDPEEAISPCRGAAFVYGRSGTQWVQQQKLVPSDRQAGDLFGYSVALSGNHLLVGAFGKTVGGRLSQGSAYVFERTGAVFVERQQLVANDGIAQDQFGLSVAIDGEVAVIGAPGHEHAGENSNHGSAYLFVRSGTTFVQDRELRDPEGQNDDALGTSVVYSGGLALLGAPNDDGPLAAQGSVQIVSFQGTNGQACTASTQCASGFCNDGRCCNAACDGACDACSVAAGATRDGECTLVGGAAPGASACAPLTCNGQGTACARCAGDTDCAPSAFCDASGACQPRKALGRACEPSFECKTDGCRVCQSGHCVEGTCCNDACTNGCSSCNALLTGAAPGTCAPVLGGTDPKDACEADPGFPDSCGADGECNGASACRTSAPEGTSCGDLACSGGTASDFSCNGSGACLERTLECGDGTAGAP